MARGTFPNQHAVQPPSQHPGPLSSHPPFRGRAPSFYGQAAPGQGAGTGAHSGPHPMVNGNVHGSINGNMVTGDDSWIPSAHQVISNALRSSGLVNVQNHSMVRPPVPVVIAPGPGFGLQNHVLAPPNSPAEGFAQLATAANTYGPGASVP
ncbi:hypothetical protein NW754_015548 [Fusarium falciforme]|uniref:Uncharacterized protein n=1 Tax=Fusarium falciforme TaxID=195108 RepID=A0A9W8QUE3_9HYPO|nr:hypothetical protein NW754_015548 [Fusarium falciforme]KAJ4179358.1 hypothetical protein NW755_012580 [Fusarium falciforme]